MANLVHERGRMPGPVWLLQSGAWSPDDESVNDVTLGLSRVDARDLRRRSFLRAMRASGCSMGGDPGFQAGMDACGKVQQ